MPGEQRTVEAMRQLVGEAVAEMGVGPRAMLFSRHVDSIVAAGLFMEDIWNEKRIITIDLLGDEFLETVQTGDPIVIHADGTVEVGE